MFRVKAKVLYVGGLSIIHLGNGYALIMQNIKDSPKQRRFVLVIPIDHPHVVVIKPQGHTRIVSVVSSKNITRR